VGIFKSNFTTRRPFKPAFGLNGDFLSSTARKKATTRIVAFLLLIRENPRQK
jgi:hypothetical protein